MSRDLSAQLSASSELERGVERSLNGPDGGRRIDRIFGAEYRTWLPDNILFKQDKTLMARSIEGRVPFCDHRLAEFAARLPMRFKLGGGRNKKILRGAAKTLFPAEVQPKAKKAFLVPMDGDCGKAQMAVARDVLSGARFERRGIFDRERIRQLMDEYPRSPFLAGKQLMALTMFELWMENVYDV